MVDENEAPGGFDFNAMPGIDWTQLEGHANGEEVGPPEGGTVEHISPEMLAKRILWDVSPCHLAEAVRDLLGYAPASEDVEDMEHRESHERLSEAALLFPLVADMSHHAAMAIVGSMIVGSGDEISDELREETIEKLEPVIVQSSFSLIAELLDTGILHLPHFGVTYLSPDDEGEDLNP